jgi:hypothetical protein
MTTRKLCQLVGLEDEAIALVPVLFGLQTAHDGLMDRAIKERVELAFKAGTITTKQVPTMLGMDASLAATKAGKC